MKNEKIIDTWNKIEPDAETKQKIFDNITKKQNQKIKRPKFKNMLIIAAVISAVLVLMGAGIVVYETVYYDMSGNKREINFPSFSIYEPGSDEYEFEEELRKNIKNNELFFVHMSNSRTSSRTSSPYKMIEDYDEFKEYLQNNGGEEFNLPEYLPKGFEFGYAQIFISITEDANYEEFEPIYYEEKFGNIYEKYLLPENQTRIESIIVYYRNGIKSISCFIGFSNHTVDEIDDMIFGLSGRINTEPEIIDIPQFERSTISSYKNGILNINPTWYLKTVKITDEPVILFHNDFISKTWCEKYEYLDSFRTWETNLIVYIIDSNSISRDEIIKIAESIK